MASVDAARLALAQKRVLKGAEIAVAQRERIARLRVLGCDTEQEKRLLRTFETTLTLFEAELERVAAECAGEL